MTENLSAAQQAQLDNRDSTGQWKPKTHAQVTAPAEALGLDHRSREYVVPGHAGEGTIMPTASAESLTTPEERQRLEDWYAKMSRHHGVKAGHARMDLSDDVGGSPRRELIDAHDLHTVRAAAYRLPPNATRAKLLDGEVTAVYDRDGEGRAFTGVSMETIDGYNAGWVDEDETAARDGAVIVDLDGIRGFDGGEHGRDAPEPQRRISMRPLSAGDQVTVGDQLYLDASHEADDRLPAFLHGEVVTSHGSYVRLLDDDGDDWEVSSSQVRPGIAWTRDQATLIDPDEPPDTCRA